MKYLLFIAAFAAGTLLAFVGYLIAKKTLLKKSGNYPAVSMIRQFLNIAYLAALFFIAKKTGWDLYALFIGGALGATVPSFLLTAKLVRFIQNGKTPDQTEDDNG